MSESNTRVRYIVACLIGLGRFGIKKLAEAELDPIPTFDLADCAEVVSTQPVDDKIEAAGGDKNFGVPSLFVQRHYQSMNQEAQSALKYLEEQSGEKSLCTSRQPICKTLIATETQVGDTEDGARSSIPPEG